MNYRRYPEYKTTGLRWLDEVPSHWQIVQSRRLFAQRKDRATEDDAQLSASQKHGIVFQADYMAVEGARVVQVIKGADILKHVEPNDFVISMRSFQGGIEWSGLRGSISSAYVMLIPGPAVHPPYYRHLLKSRPYIQALQSTSDLVRDGQALRFDNFALVDLPSLPASEQSRIASFLDLETARIDALIEKKTRFIELLREKRQALITQAVTQGLDPSVPTKDSGVEWLGRVPEHWTVVRLKHVICRIEQGWSPECFSYPAEPGEWGVLKSGCVNRGSFNSNENKCLPPDQEPREDIEVKAGDVLMSRASGSPELIGSVARAALTTSRLMLSDKIFRISLSNMDADFFVQMMGARPLRLQIEQSISGAEGLANNLPQAGIKEFVVVVPPLSEQTAIAKHIESSTGRIDQLLDATRASISLLAERRSALITAAVTGQIDLRETA